MITTIRTLRRAGCPLQAFEFQRKAMQLTQNDDDTSELLALASEYVEVI